MICSLQLLTIKEIVYVELLQHSEIPTEHRQLSTASSVQLLLMSQSSCQRANAYGDEIVKALELVSIVLVCCTVEARAWHLDQIHSFLIDFLQVPVD